MMPSAAGRMLAPWSAPTASGSAATIASTGRRQPMTPVDAGRTSLGAIPSAAAAAAQTRSAASTPPGAQTFETLLLTTMAPRRSAGQPLAPDEDGRAGESVAGELEPRTRASARPAR